ncbi:uncharacterized protein LY89DRAFT_182616 [Mollisia scopiformis]|uniref:C2H2-type domain-containing protein n=1 Tax=Mollisia scopiformis TaxID=149040 RepID=A0A194XTS3_MOLSC|nr:uncharacterized protein LY89DRAFT_182616 [Mollisia scopiformis]KUJ23439.1 hypothetical protein LY89DRAFT_182616 [Mollisia scopiformis]
MFKRSRTQRSYVNGDDEISVVKVQQPEFTRPARADTISSARSSCSDVDPSDYEVHESCVIRNFPKHKSSHLRFLAWVAYTRKYTDESITDDERRTCPLLWCRSQFKDQETMLQHVYNCPYLSKGLYWCFHCQKPERVGNFKCRRCQGAPSRTDRISSVAKKIFSKLGAKPHRSDHSDIFKHGKDLSKFSEHTEFRESSLHISQSNFDGPWDPRQAQELPSDSVVREMPGDLSAASYELADTYISEMVGTECPIELGVGSENWADNLYIDEWESSAPKVQDDSPKPRLSVDTSCSPVSLLSTHAKLAHNSTWDDTPLSATIISPMSATGAYDYSALEISPTESDTSGNTFSTLDSGYSSATSYTAPSAWDFSMTGLESFGSMKDRKGKKREIGQISGDWANGAALSGPPIFPSIPSISMSQDVTVSRSNSSSTTHSASRCPISERPKPVSPHWRNASDLVQSFSEVLDAHIEHTKAALKELPSTSITQELLAMSRTSMVSLGLDVLQGILEGRNPTAIIQVFAFMHIAFALAIAVDQDEAKVETQAWFQDSLTWVQELPSERQQQVYLQIARAVWQPLDASSMSSLSARDTAQEKQRLLFESCKHFLDVFESLGSCDDSEPSSDFDFEQASFETKAKTQVIDELIQIVGIEAFIEDVVTVERRLTQGQITSVRGLELDLIFAGKLASQSDATYSRFVAHVTSLCDVLYAEGSLHPRTAYHIRDIAEIKRLLPEENYNDDYGAQTHDLQEQDLCDEDLLLSLDWERGQGALDVSTTALTRDLDEILSQASTSHHHGSFNVPPRPASLPAMNQQHLSPFAIPTSHHRSSSSASRTNCPPPTPHPTPFSTTTSPFAPPPTPNPAPSPSALRCHCGYIPTGEEKWKASNLRRHKRTQHPSEEKRKVYKCKVKGCKSTFTRSDNLRSHAREKHGVDCGRRRAAGLCVFVLFWDGGRTCIAGVFGREL